MLTFTHWFVRCECGWEGEAEGETDSARVFHTECNRCTEPIDLQFH